ncbi:MAG: hypothetical protein ACJ76H_01745 [Bacteriovoracaceae bacterium]
MPSSFSLKNSAPLAIIFIALAFIYFPYVEFDTMVGRDDNLLVVPLHSIHSLSDYFSAVATNKILDVQPLRDLSLYINIKIAQWTNFQSFHLFNLLIHLANVFIFYRLLSVIIPSRRMAWMGTALFAFHPVFVSSVGWVSARKHSLALMFTLLALLDFMKHRTLTWRAVLSYLASICCHQIHFLLPVWFWFVSRWNKWKLNRKPFIVMVISGAIVFAVSAYKTFVVNSLNTTYLKPDFLSNLSRYVLSLGRAGAIILFPYSISGFYWQGSLWNLVGLVLIVAVSYLFCRRSRDTVPFLLLAFLAFIPTFIAFINDTYIYLPLACMIICVCLVVRTFPISSKSVDVMFGVLTLAVLMKTISIAGMWRSPQALWKVSYDNEPSPHNAIGLSGHIRDREAGMRLLTWGAQNYDFEAPYLLDYFFQSVSSSPLPREEKKKIFQSAWRPLSAYEANYAVFLLQGSDEERKTGIEMLTRLISGPGIPEPLVPKINSLCHDNECPFMMNNRETNP